MATMTHTCPDCKTTRVETTWPHKKTFSKSDVKQIQATQCTKCSQVTPHAQKGI